MPFKSIRTLDGPLALAGPRETTPPTAMRRNRGLALIPNARVARSRAGSALVTATTGTIPLANFSNVVLGRVADTVANLFTDAVYATVAGLHRGFAIGPSVADNAATAGDFFYYASGIDDAGGRS